VKQAAARANAQLGVLDRGKAALIDRVCEEIKNGRLRAQFVVDIMQGGAGTPTNMNVNEVIANRGLELSGHAKGDYQHLDPNDHVNCGQSMNDTYPTALKIALCLSIRRLLMALRDLSQSFRDRGRRSTGILEVGRIRVQDAVPIMLEQEFEAFAVTLAEDSARLESVMDGLRKTNLGGAAIETGSAADPLYAEAVRMHLAAITGLDIINAPNLVEASPVFMELSGALRRCAMKLSKICNDMCLLSSGPQVNPAISEAVNQVAFVVAGHDVVMSMAAEGGQLRLNAFGPVIAHVLFESLQWMTAAMGTLRDNRAAMISSLP
jgi:aspartate ammonia-lyase